MKSRGFHLIELLIVLCLIAILFSFTIPNYSEHLANTRRLIAKTALMKLAGQMEAYFIEHNSYQGADFKQLNLPEWAADKHYQLFIQAATASQFVLAAVPTQLDARCGTLMLNSRGEKRISGPGKLEECW